MLTVCIHHTSKKQEKYRTKEKHKQYTQYTTQKNTNRFLNFGHTNRTDTSFPSLQAIKNVNIKKYMIFKIIIFIYDNNHNYHNHNHNHNHNP